MTPEPSATAALRAKLERLTHNLWWTWHPETIQLFQVLDPARWRTLRHNPVAFLEGFSDEQLFERAHELGLVARIESAERQLEAYLRDDRTWAVDHAGALLAHPVVYFCAEFGIHESLPLYSGGLGVLAGDHIKTASDLGLPLIGISLLYRGGYLQQRIDREGRQVETYPGLELERQPFEAASTPSGEPLRVSIRFSASDELHARVWKLPVGRATLLLLDPDVPENSEADRHLAERLYDPDARVRIRQEALLGIGGLRAVHGLGLQPSVLHLNEGHSAFAVLEAARHRMQSFGMSFETAIQQAARQTVFTTHTPVEAGHDRFAPALAVEHLDAIGSALGISHEALMGLGRVNTDDPDETFCMTVLALKCSRRRNGVSALHGIVSRKMWHCLWPDRREHEVPIGHITNGIHVASWLAPEMHQLYRRALGTDYGTRLSDPRTWRGIEQVSDEELWDTRRIVKTKLLRYVGRWVEGETGPDALPEDARRRIAERFDERTLTIGFARRFATYKRATLLLEDRDRLRRLLTNPERPVQLLFAGKAHPQDPGGKELIRQVHEIICDPSFEGRVGFLPNHDINVGRHLVQGVDVWLNNPRRHLEASGTSGQKVIMNGGLNCSILDGWYPEGYDGVGGFAFGGRIAHADLGELDRTDAEDLYRVLEEEVVPLYYDRDSYGIPARWLARVRRSIRTMAWRFNTERMLIDYIEQSYLPAAVARTATMPPPS